MRPQVEGDDHKDAEDCVHVVLQVPSLRGTPLTLDLYPVDGLSNSSRVVDLLMEG
jgi:hypothetical protein